MAFHVEPTPRNSPEATLVNIEPTETPGSTPDEQWRHWASQGDVLEPVWNDSILSATIAWVSSLRNSKSEGGVQTPSEDEVQAARKRLRGGRSPGHDGIPADVLPGLRHYCSPCCFVSLSIQSLSAWPSSDSFSNRISPSTSRVASEAYDCSAVSGHGLERCLMGDCVRLGRRGTSSSDFARCRVLRGCSRTNRADPIENGSEQTTLRGVDRSPHRVPFPQPFDFDNAHVPMRPGSGALPNGTFYIRFALEHTVHRPSDW